MDKDIKPASGSGAAYTKEFKLQAVDRLKRGESASALARELGVSRKLLYKWAERVEQGGPDSLHDRVGRPVVGAADELSRLQRENERLRMEVEILKKADAYFARPKR